MAEQPPPPGKAPLSGADLGLNLLVSILVTGGIGYAIDRYFETLPAGMLIGGFIGFCAWMRTIWQALNQKRD